MEDLGQGCSHGFGFCFKDNGSHWSLKCIWGREIGCDLIVKSSPSEIPFFIF